MKASLYYLTHTFINSIKKVFRSWVIFMILFIVICGVIGGVIGMTAGVLEDSSVIPISKKHTMKRIHRVLYLMKREMEPKKHNLKKMKMVFCLNQKQRIMRRNH